MELACDLWVGDESGGCSGEGGALSASNGADKGSGNGWEHRSCSPVGHLRKRCKETQLGAPAAVIGVAEPGEPGEPGSSMGQEPGRPLGAESKDRAQGGARRMERVAHGEAAGKGVGGVGGVVVGGVEGRFVLEHGLRLSSVYSETLEGASGERPPPVCWRRGRR